MTGTVERHLLAAGCEVVRDEPMRRRTTYRVGGPADLFVTCHTHRGLAETVRFLDEEGIERLIIGKGSNLLVSDAGFRGAVVTLGREFKAHRIDGTRIHAGAASPLAYLVQDAFSRGLAGMEFGVGVPGTLGGALVMNAGTRDAWIGDVVESATLHVPGSGLERFRGEEIDWGYRTSGLDQRGIVVEAVLSLEPGEPVSIRRGMDLLLERRKATQPLGMPCAGSVFVNPAGDSAGRLIEATRLKGTRIGGAVVSDVHANFIVNDGGASASDIIRLMTLVRDAVREAHGVELRPEIRLVGTFDTP